METCCQDIPDIACAIVGINERIVPLEYTDNTLIIDSPLLVENTLTIGGAVISMTDGHINLPAKTLVNGAPLMSSAFETINLPDNTMIDGHQPITEHYYYYFTALKGAQTLDGYIVNGYPNTVGKFSPSKQIQPTYGFSFTAPEDCVLTSLKVLCVLQTTSPNPSPAPTNISIVLDVMDTLLNTYYTGVLLEIPSPSANSRNFVETVFEYPVFKGDAAGVYVVGSTDTLGTISVFATLGYKMLPPPSVMSATPSTTYSRFQSIHEEPQHNRFPFNNIMNTQRQAPLHFEDKLRMLSSSPPQINRSQIYGQKLTFYDYDRRLSPLQKSSLNPGQPNEFSGAFSKQDIIASLLCGGGGYYIDFSSSDHNDTTELAEAYTWKGILIGRDKPERPLSLCIQAVEDMDYFDIFSQNNVPPYIDYLSLDVRETGWAQDTLQNFAPIILNGHYRFGVIVVRHDKSLLAIKLGNDIVPHYKKVFTGVQVDEAQQVFEDWYVCPNLLHPAILKMMAQQDTNGIRWAACKDIITNIIRPGSLKQSMLQKVFDKLAK